MYDNKIRLSPDVVQKAELIAAEWGLKNARAAVEAVFRKYADEYMYGRLGGALLPATMAPERLPQISPSLPQAPSMTHYGMGGFANNLSPNPGAKPSSKPSANCEALDALDDLLAL
jgi:hypothetical protein